MKAARIATAVLLAVGAGLLVFPKLGVTQAEAASPLQAVSAVVLGQTTGSATTEVLVLNSAATILPCSGSGGTTTIGTKGRSAIEVFNHGPNNIYCAFSSATAVIDKSRPILPDTAWAVDAQGAVCIWCKAKTADQVTGAATVVSELKNN